MKSFSFKFFPNLRTLRGDKCKIYGRLIISRKKVEFATNYSIEPENWDKNSNYPKRDMLLKQNLVEIEQKVYRIIRKYEDENIDYTSKEVVDDLKNKGDKYKSVSLLNYYDDFIEYLIDKGELSKGTIKHYKTTRKVIETFLHRVNKISIPISNIDYFFIKDFDLFLSKDYKSPQDTNIARNSINKHHSRIRAILNSAIKEDLIQINPYRSFPLKNEKVHRESLTEDELEAISSLDFSENKSLDKIRDIFIFSCNTAIRFEDSQYATMDKIKKFNGKDKYIEVLMGKTKEKVVVPLTIQALTIIEKYNNHPTRLIKNRILPEISNQKFNEYIKVIMRLAGISKKVSHHIARHTFATIALNKGIDITVVQKLLGHKSIRTTQIYAKMLDKTIFKEMKKMEMDKNS